jgi:hypothetical protein
VKKRRRKRDNDRQQRPKHDAGLRRRKIGDELRRKREDNKRNEGKG